MKNPERQLMFPGQRFDLASLLDMLTLTTETAIEGTAQTAALFLDAARYRVSKMDKRMQSEGRLKKLKSKLGTRYRKELTEQGSRVTEGQVAECLGRNSKYCDAETELEQSELEEEFSKLVLEAFRMRRDALKVYAELVGAELYVQRRMGTDGTELDKMREKLKARYREMKVKKQKRTRD